MHNLGKYKKLTQCPGCPCHDKTFEHMYNCTHPMMQKAVSEGKQQLLDRAQDCKIKRKVMEKFMTSIECNIMGIDAPIPQFLPELCRAVADQNKNNIGTAKLLQGYMAKSWILAMEQAGVKRPHAMAKTLQRLLWDTLSQKIWESTNHILHHTPNVYRMAESADLRERLRYYRDN
jgi:hypothetical protein